VTGYNTNLAAEFYVLSMLHRLGADATLTLGNKKGVDIVVVRDTGDAVTIDVKGVAARYDWPAGNVQSPHPERHFVVLVSFEGQISNPAVAPRCWVVPFPDLEPYLWLYGTRLDVLRSSMEAYGTQFENGWSLITGQPPD
jgi:hypothetical protein